MRNLFFPALVLFALSLTLASCSKENLVTQDEVIPAETDLIDARLVVPYGYDTDDTYATSYIQNAATTEIEIMKENYRVAQFLTSIEKINLIERTLSFGDHISSVSLEDFLTSEELQQLTNYTLTPTVSRSVSCTRVWLGPPPCSAPCDLYHCHIALRRCCAWDPVTVCYYEYYIEC